MTQRPELAWRPLTVRRAWRSKAQLADGAVGAGVLGYVYDGHRGLAAEFDADAVEG